MYISLIISLAMFDPVTFFISKVSIRLFYVLCSAKISFIVRVFSFTSLIIVIIGGLKSKFQFNFPPLPSSTFFFFKPGMFTACLSLVIQESAREWGRAYTHTGLPFFGSPLSGVPPPHQPVAVEVLGSFSLWTEG